MMRPFLPCLACLLVGAAAHAAGQRLEVVFVADGGGPSAIVEVHEKGEAQHIVRAGAWVFFAGDTSVSKAMSDRVRGSRRAPSLADLPAAPAGLGLTGDVDGTLVFTLDELGDWQASLESSSSSSSSSGASGGPPVPAVDAARLLVEPPPVMVPKQRYTTRAVLYGTRGAYEGLAVVDTRQAPRREAELVLRGSDSIAREPFGSEARSAPRAFIADRGSACERAVPTALLLWPEGAAPARIIASAAPACLPGGRAVVPFAGVRLEARREVPLRGLLVEEAAASDRAAFLLRAHGLQ